ncbi:MAG: hypothetical protein J6Q34_02620 [Bacteroidales bacterium]|nr:hypothetical protein [Bacteroidales bacterium]
MGRVVNLSPLGLYNWDDTIFDLMQIPSALDKETLVQNLLAETAELEVLYPNPVVFKNLVGVWSAKQIDIWNRLYATTQYEYNPIENYNRYETGSDSGTGRTTHSGTDTTTETTTHGGTDGRTEAISTGGKDTLDMTRREGGTEEKTGTVGMEQGGTETENTTSSVEQGGQDVTTGSDTKGHWVAGFDSQPSGQDDGLVKQTRDQDDATTTTEYGKTEDGTGTKTTDFGKTEDTETSETTTFGKTETNKDETTYGRTENVQETKTYGETINKQGGLTHGEQVATTNEGEHELHAHGNIGVTTTQKLIREQREIDLFNLYDIIIEDFKMRFCILVY